MWRVLVVLAACLSAHARISPCPANCECGYNNRIQCRSDRGTITIEEDDNVDLTIHLRCEGTELTCADFPKVNSAEGDTMRLVATACPSSVLSCVAPALGASGVRDLTLHEPQNAFTPNDVRGMDLHSMYFYKARNLRSIPYDVLRIQPSLLYLVVTNAQLRLVRDGFENAGPLTTVVLRSDGITYLPDAAFRGLNRVQHLELPENNIETIRTQSLLGLDSLETLVLDNNPLSNVEAQALAGTPKLREFSASNHSFSGLREDMFRGSQLEKIIITYGKQSMGLQSRTFASLPKLKKLVLEHNRISSVPEDLLVGSSALGHLSLAHNEITVVPSELLREQTQLKHLDLSNNKISSVGQDVFVLLSSLKKLDLSRNEFVATPMTVFPDKTGIKIDLSYNKITELETHFLQMLMNNVRVDLQYNNISRVILHDVIARVNNTQPPPAPGSVPVVQIYGNPLHCDCGLYGLATRIHRGSAVTFDSKVLVGQAACASPPSKAGQIFRYMTPDELCDEE